MDKWITHITKKSLTTYPSMYSRFTYSKIHIQAETVTCTNYETIEID